MDSRTTFRLGIDIGGTFTDGVLVDDQQGTVWIDKVLTTPHDPSRGFLQCLLRLAKRAALNLGDLQSIIHATTIATNALLERRGARAGLLVTKGFRDILEIARQVRYELYNLQTQKPPALVPRERCFEVAERLNYRGEVQLPLDEETVASAVRQLRAQQVDSIAVCFLHSYQNAAHEKRAAELIRELYPQASISLSSAVAPEIREYWRASTTVTNAYIGPVVSRYLNALEEGLQGEGVTAPVRIMQSSGGIMSLEAAKQRPVYWLESGPAAGVVSAKYFAELIGCRNAISFDMGGTTAKMGLILDGEAKVVAEFEAGGASGSGTGVLKGSGYPILAPMIDLVEVSAGGGSLAWIDSGGLLRVGPRSAGADPGPACYKKGGAEPTITDANLVLGRLNPGYFLGGEIPLDTEASRQAIASRCASPLGMDTASTARGIIDIANATMVEAMRLISVQRGYDPADFSLIVLGGAGPMHANRLADELRIPRVIIPPSPGVGCALGMLVSDLRHDFRVTRLQRLDEVRCDELNALAQDFRSRVLAELAREGVAPGQVAIERYVEMRYVGQSWKLRIPLDDRDFTADDVAVLRQKFNDAHRQTYGYFTASEPVEVVNVGMVGIGRLPKHQLKQIPKGGASAARAQKASRPVYFQERSGFTACPIFDRYALCEGNVIEGPAIIEEIDSTTVVHPGYQAEVMACGILILKSAP